MSEKLKVGPYIVVGLLGHGGMGSVYRAHHETLEREVALKVLLLGAADDDVRVARFRREAEAAMSLTHPGVVKVYDYGTDGSRQYLAMELVNGATLKEVIEKAGALPVTESVNIAAQLLEALGACHALGLLHRDVKPANVMLERSGRARLLDLGLVKQIDRTILTAEGSVVGTPRYMPPEMLASGEMDHRGDIYQVAIVFYECLTGKPVADAEGLMEVVEQVLNAPPPPLPEVLANGPRGAREFLTRALCKDPAGRFQSTVEAVQCLRSAVNSLRMRTTARAAAEAEAQAAPAPASTRTPVSGSPVTRTPVAGVSRSMRTPTAVAGAPVPDAPTPAAGPLPRSVRLAVHATTAITLVVGLVIWLALARRGPVADGPSPGASIAPVVPHGLSVEAGPASLRVSWRTDRAVYGVVTLPAIGRSEREDQPKTGHVVLLERLVPETRYVLEVGDRESGPQLSHTAVTRSVAGVVREMSNLLEVIDVGSMISDLKADLINPFRTKDAKMSASWRARIRKKFGGDDFQQVSKDFRSIRHLLAEADVAVAARARITQRLNELEDLHEMVEMGLKFDSGLRPRDLAPPGLAVEDKLPPGLKPMVVVRFGPPNAEVELPLCSRTIEAGEPMTFNQDFYNLLTNEPAKKTRKNYDIPAPLSTAGRLERVYLGFRATQGLPIEKVLVWSIAKDKLFLGRIPASRGAPPPERFIRLDERLIAEPSNSLVLTFVNRDVVLTGAGVRVYSLVLYGEHP